MGFKTSVCLFPILNREAWGIEGQALLLLGMSENCENNTGTLSSLKVNVVIH